MAKNADKYFKTDAWCILEEGFNPEYGEVAESIFSQGNEYMGTRGYFEEGYSGSHLIGSYFNCIYERIEHPHTGYKGTVNTTEYMVNSVNWLYTRISLDGEKLDLAKSSFRDFKRVLDLRTGLLTRSFVWQTESGREIELTFERLISMNHIETGLQRITMKALNFRGVADLELGLDFAEPHQNTGESIWICSEHRTKERYFSIMGETPVTGQNVFSSCLIQGDIEFEKNRIDDKFTGGSYKVTLVPEKEQVITRFVHNYVSRTHEDLSLFLTQKASAETVLAELDFDRIREESADWWTKVWENSDITIEGDDLNQQGIRYCIFQMFQTYHGAVDGANIGAKGLTGESYNGNAFWDTETYCLPFYMSNNPKAVKNLLTYRYKTLGEAKKRARELDCEGAFYPIATISGRECCNLWQHASLQLQASTAVAYGIWFYEKNTDDLDFLKTQGAEMLVEISRMLATRGDFSADGSRYGFYGVMGPDEFQMMVHNNCYTNYMGRLTLNYTLEVLALIEENSKEDYEALVSRLGIKTEEVTFWKKIADRMYIPYDPETKLFEQSDGFFKMPHIDVDSIPVEDFPLYHNWTYDRIYRNDMIKQPDVLMMMFLLNSSFTTEELLHNYEYYEPRCIHESSLSPSVHSVLANQLHKYEEAFSFFQFATRMDLDNYNRNTREGLHTTSIAAAWINIVYGFGGMRLDGDGICFSPSLPNAWTSYSFRVTIGQSVIRVTVTAGEVQFDLLTGNDLVFAIYGQPYTLGKEGLLLAIPKEWR